MASSVTALSGPGSSTNAAAEPTNGQPPATFNGNHSAPMMLIEKYELPPDYNMTMVNKLELLKQFLKEQIRKEFKIKEGAENLRRASNDRKSLANVDKLVKQSNHKLGELQQDLAQVDRFIVEQNDSGVHSQFAQQRVHQAHMRYAHHRLSGGVGSIGFSGGGNGGMVRHQHSVDNSLFDGTYQVRELVLGLLNGL